MEAILREEQSPLHLRDREIEKARQKRKCMPSRFSQLLGIVHVLLSYTVADGKFVSFGYTRDGPANWGNLSPDYKTCSSGTQQSPINIMEDDFVINTKLRDLNRFYVDAKGTLINTGFNIMLKFDQGAGFMSQGGKNYTLKQLQWHTPSEHTVDKQQFDMELQLMHSSDDGNIAILSILYDLGNPDPFIYQDSLNNLSREYCSEDEETHLPVDIVRTKALKRHKVRYFKYIGSLTTPPCTENVTWYILGKVRKVSKNQVALIKSALNREFQNNARPTQPLNGRIIERYIESKFNPH
ncbi:hypothetical protein HPP92_006350 [Vanilla planifolia]|uniref:Alpha-carbonic anhydrase domain-containing protein n=1 Tax=Vanilla planifolia TaxID=51239 RepID=A0A835VBT3_VANPL|nr:hypothetical protein HPP92_006350 [Vanilla planifolia]